MPEAQSAILHELTSSLEQVNLSRYLCGAALILSLYDWILLFGDESMTIWKTKWSLPKAIYYFNRIVTPLGLSLATFHLTDIRTSPLSSDFCTNYTYANGLIELFSFFLSNWLLTLRLVALYKRKRWVRWFLYTFLVISYVVAAILMVWTLREYGLTIHYSPVLHACGSLTRSPLMPAIFFTPAAFEFTLFLLTGLRAWQDAKIMTSSASAPFLTILYRDGIISFFVMFGARIWNIWIYATQPIASAYMGVYLFWAIMSILSTRVYLNLVFLARKPTLEPTEVSRPQFAQQTGWGGIKMRVQTMTVGDAGEIIAFGGPEDRPPMPVKAFDSTFGIDSILHADADSPWTDLARKDSASSLPPSRRHSSHRPFSSLTFVQDVLPPPPPIINEKEEA